MDADRIAPLYLDGRDPFSHAAFRGHVQRPRALARARTRAAAPHQRHRLHDIRRRVRIVRGDLRDDRQDDLAGVEGARLPGRHHDRHARGRRHARPVDPAVDHHDRLRRRSQRLDLASFHRRRDPRPGARFPFLRLYRGLGAAASRSRSDDRRADYAVAEAPCVAAPDPDRPVDCAGAGIDLRRDRDRHRGGGLRRGRRAADLRRAGLVELDDVPRQYARGDAALLHDRADPSRRVVPHAGDGLYRFAAASGRMDRRVGLVAACADRRADGFLYHPRLFSRRHFDGRADDGRHIADGRESGHRSGVVRHFYRARGRDGADNAAGRLQPVRPAGNDPKADHLDSAAGAADVLPDGRGDLADLLFSAAGNLSATPDEVPMNRMGGTEPYAAKFVAPFAVLGIRTSGDAVTGIDYRSKRERAQAPADAAAERACRQLERYLGDPEFRFSLPLAPAGTAFRRKVWAALATIPVGESRTYGEL